MSTTVLVASMLAIPLAITGMGASLWGRIRIHRIGDRYFGAPLAWIGYLGGMALVVVAVGLGVYGIGGMVL